MFSFFFLVPGCSVLFCFGLFHASHRSLYHIDHIDHVDHTDHADHTDLINHTDHTYHTDHVNHFDHSYNIDHTDHTDHADHLLMGPVSVCDTYVAQDACCDRGGAFRRTDFRNLGTS